MLAILLTLATLHWIVLVTPGANFLLVGQLAASGQRSQALAAAAGITCVTLTWATLAVLGIGIVFHAHPALRQLVQIAGGLYLLYLASKLWQSKGQSQTAALQHISLTAAFRMGFLTNILNPKTALFFGSVFATVLPAQPDWSMTLSAVLLVYANAVIWHVFLALAFSHPAIQSRYDRQRQSLSRFSSLMVGLFGTRLLWTTLQELRGRWL